MKGRAASLCSVADAEPAAGGMLRCAGLALTGAVIGIAATLAAGSPTAAQHADQARIVAVAIAAFAAVCTMPGQTRERATRRMEAFVAKDGFGALPFAFDFYDTSLGDTHPDITSGTAFIEGRELLQKKRAAVHVGTPAGSDGLQTFINAERLPPPEY